MFILINTTYMGLFAFLILLDANLTTNGKIVDGESLAP